MVIFVKSVPRCTALCKLLTEQNFPAVEIHRGMAQEDRFVDSQLENKNSFIYIHIYLVWHVIKNSKNFKHVFLLLPIYLDVVWILNELISSLITICRKIQILIFIE